MSFHFEFFFHLKVFHYNKDQDKLPRRLGISVPLHLKVFHYNKDQDMAAKKPITMPMTSFKGIPLQQGSRQNNVTTVMPSLTSFKGIPLQQGSRLKTLVADIAHLLQHLKVFHYNKDQD